MATGTSALAASAVVSGPLAIAGNSAVGGAHTVVGDTLAAVVAGATVGTAWLATVGAAGAGSGADAAIADW